MPIFGVIKFSDLTALLSLSLLFFLCNKKVPDYLYGGPFQRIISIEDMVEYHSKPLQPDTIKESWMVVLALAMIPLMIAFSFYRVRKETYKSLSDIAKIVKDNMYRGRAL